MKPALIQEGQKYLTNGSSWILKKSESIQSKTLRFISIQMAPKHGNTVLKQQLIMRLLFLMEDGKKQDWFGTYYDLSFPWIYHTNLRWIYFSESADGSFWIWSESLGWIWSHAESFPYFFSKSSEDWLYLNFEKSETGQYYDFKNKSWYNLK